jgi:hypothetical protein
LANQTEKLKCKERCIFTKAHQKKQAIVNIEWSMYIQLCGDLSGTRCSSSQLGELYSVINASSVFWRTPPVSILPEGALNTLNKLFFLAGPPLKLLVYWNDDFAGDEAE